MFRNQMLTRIRDPRVWDFVVIGGGATGLGTALDAVSRGYQTLLLDSHDFAKGTSSRSTKLIHGGVRYLARGEIGLVREALHERGLLRQNAPHLVHARQFLVPAYSLWDMAKYGVGLKVYDALAGNLRFGSSRWISRAETLETVPTLEPKRLRGGILYADGQFDDTRLAIALLKTILDRGGTALNYVSVTGLLKTRGLVCGVTARDVETGEEFSISARSVINATGVFADTVRRMDDEQAPALIRPSRGVHIVLDREFLPSQTALMVPRTEDGRVVFAIPWHNRVIIGTTDTAVDATPIEPSASEEEIAFLLRHAGRYLTRDPEIGDIRSVFSGLRPLIERSTLKGTTAQLSREHVVLVANSGLVTVAGGKWTTYRKMASDAVDRAIEVAGLSSAPCVTANLRLHGAEERLDTSSLASYGSEATDVRDLIATRPGWDQRLHPSLPYQVGEVVWAVRQEMARQVEDVLARRLRALFLDARASIEAAPRVAALMAEELRWSEAWQSTQVEQFRFLARNYLPP